MTSSVNSASLEGYSTGLPRGVLKKTGNNQRQSALASQESSILFSLEGENFKLSAPGLENSFKMKPDTSFNSERVRKLAEDILHGTFDGMKYERERCRQLALKASEELKDKVKAELGCNRFKFVCLVYLGSKQSQGMSITSRCLLDERFDRCATASFQNGSLFVVATIYGIYLE